MGGVSGAGAVPGCGRRWGLRLCRPKLEAAAVDRLGGPGSCRRTRAAVRLGLQFVRVAAGRDYYWPANVDYLTSGTEDLIARRR